MYSELQKVLIDKCGRKKSPILGLHKQEQSGYTVVGSVSLDNEERRTLRFCGRRVYLKCFK